MTGHERFDQPEMWGALADTEEFRDKVRHFRQMVPDGASTALDVGCGDGAITNELGRSLDITGVDLSEAALAHVEGPSQVASATDLPFADSSFDLVLSSQVLEHLSEEDYRRALSEMRRVARRHLLISVPYREDLALREIRCPACGHRHHVWGHVRSFTIDSLLADLPGTTARDIRVFGTPQEPAWPRPLIGAVHAMRFHYVPEGQSPLCPNCGNRDYSRARGIPFPAWMLKRGIDRLRAPGKPFWLAVLVDK